MGYKSPISDIGTPEHGQLPLQFGFIIVKIFDIGVDGFGLGTEIR